MAGMRREIEEMSARQAPGIEATEHDGATGARWRGRELALFEVAAVGGARTRVVEIASVFGGRLIGSSPSTMTVEAAGLPDEIDALEELLRDHGIVAMARSGPITLD